MIRINPNFLPLGTAAALLVAAVGFTASCSKSGEVKAADISSAPDAAVLTVPVAEASLTPMSHSEELTAEFRPFQEIELMSKVAGYVKKINVDVGDRVEQGQVLAELEIPELADDMARAQAGVARAQADVVRAKDEELRAEDSHEIAHLSARRLADVAKQKSGLVAQQEVDDAHSKDMVAEAVVKSAQSALAAAQEQVKVAQTEIKRVQTMIDYTRIIAPFNGVVTKRSADTGSMLQAGTSSNALPLVRLSQNSMLRLTVPVPESLVPKVKLGETVEVRVPTLNRTFSGKVARFAEKVAQATRTMDTEVDVPNPSGVLVPGMFAEVHLTVDSRPSVLTVPIPAVDFGQDDTTGQTLVVDSQNKVEARKLTLGMQDDSNVEVVSGLSPGDRVVTANRSALRPGQDVRAKVVAMDSKK